MVKMNKKRSVHLMAFILLASTVMLAGSSNLFVGTSSGFVFPASSWSGYVTILPDGSLSNPGAPITHTGDNYNFTGNINGTLTVNREGAIIDGNGYSMWNTVSIPVVSLSNANGITLQNLTVAAWYSTAINIVSSTNDTILNNTVDGMVTGIYVYSPYNTVENNVVNMSLTKTSYHGLSAGIMVKASSSTITGNTIVMGHQGSGIILQAAQSHAVGNAISITGQSSNGIEVNGAYNTVEMNTITGTGTDDAGMLLIIGSQSNLVERNNVSLTGLRAVAVSLQDGFNTVQYNNVTVSGTYSNGLASLSSGTGGNLLSGNSVNVSGRYSVGIYDNSQGTMAMGNTIDVLGPYSRGITSANNPVISQNTINIVGNYTYGISTPTGSVSGNTIMAAGIYTYGIYSWGAQSVSFSGNTINATGDNAYGILLNGQYATATGNVIQAGTSNGTGIMTNALTYSNFGNNSILFTSTGLFLSSHTSYNLTFQGNYLLNDTVAFNMTGDSTNLFFHNSFINSTSYTINGGYSATWDNGYPSGGNYWSNYTGVDLLSGPGQNLTGSDGIGDAQFNLTSINVDHYPLMAPWAIPTVTFTETGLPDGQAWAVTFNGVLKESTASSITFNIESAAFSSYNFTIGDIQGFTHSLSTGSVDFIGDSINVQVVFQSVPEATYNIVFTQTGLPEGTQWSVTLDGTTLSSTGATITFDPLNGTYSYTITGIAGYTPGTLSGTVVVNGQDVGVSATFTQVTYSVQFVALGLHDGLTWYVNLSSGHSLSSASQNMEVYLPNGTYTYTVDNVGAYNSTPSTGTFTVSGGSPNSIGIFFNTSAPVPPPEQNATPGLGIWAYVIGIIIGGAVVGITAVGLYYYRRK